MIRVEPTDEPASFDDRCRQRGKAWIASHTSWTRLPDYWTEFRPNLRAAFEERCAYLGLWIASGTVDHFRSQAGADGTSLAYEWSNYRYSEHGVNSAKKPAWDGRILDPFEVQDAWFEVHLPSCLLRLVEANVPHCLLERARFTVEKLRLDQGEDIVALRREWLRMHEDEGLSLDGLRRKAPLVARAVERRNALEAQPGPTRT